VKLDELAARINAHLKRFEADKQINAPRASHANTPPFFNAGAFRAGRYVGVRYISYQYLSHLTRDEAARYLAKLDAGFVGRHFEALRDAPPSPAP
jgi:DNA-binding response OmpR family regulator